MADDEAWTSGESEPEERDPDDEETYGIDLEDLEDVEYVEDQIYEDSWFFPSIKDFNGTSEINQNINVAGNTPIDFFNYFFDSSLIEMIIEETNRYHFQNPGIQSDHMKPWTPLTKEDFEIFLGLSILMGHVRKSELHSYWSTDQLLQTPIFRQMMSRDRYLQILCYIHFNDNENTTSDIAGHTLAKIKPVIDFLQSKFSAALTPGKKVCIDESLLLWKGRLRFKQYIPLKRNRFGIKLFELVDCEMGFILNFIVYTGADTDYRKFGLGVSGDIVAHFLEPYHRQGRVVYVDNWYTSPALAEFLHDRDTGLCGTVKANRKGMPKLENKLSRAQIQVAHTDVWMAMKWEDKRSVRMLSTVHEVDFCPTGKKRRGTDEDIMKPTCIHDYNQNMGGVDNVDRQLSITETVRKTMKWYRKLFFHLVDLCLSNAHAMYKMRNAGPAPFPEFRLEVVRALLKCVSESIPRNVSHPNRLIGRHFPKDSTRRRCHLCSLRKITRRTSYICSTCDIPLCVTPCFEEYHTQQTLT